MLAAMSVMKRPVAPLAGSPDTKRRKEQGAKHSPYKSAVAPTQKPKVTELYDSKTAL